MILNYKHIIWDWNGTLINDSWLCVEIINEFLAARGMKVLSMQRYRDIFGFPVKSFYEKIGFDFSSETFRIIATEYHDEYNRRRFECSLHDGVKGIIPYFKAEGAGQSVLSASQLSALEEALQYYSLDSCFDYISGLDNHYAESKIDIAKELFNRIGLPENEVVIIGDTVHDFEVASALGIDCILFSGGHHNRSRLELCGVPVMESFSEIDKYTLTPA